jgi:hypothetical protein
MNSIKGLKWFLGAVALAGLAACGGGGESPDAPAGAPPQPADPQARATIGAAGGEVTFADQRFKLTIPAGALGNATEIVITELSPANVPANLKPLGTDKVYRLEPSGLQFAQPVTATAQLPASDAIALMVHESNGSFEIPAGQEVALAKSGRTVSGPIAHFSHLVFPEPAGMAARIVVTPKSLPVGGTVNANVSLATIGAGVNGKLEASRFAHSNVDLKLVELPPSPTEFRKDETKAVNASLLGRCEKEGPGWISYTADFTYTEFGTTDWGFPGVVARNFRLEVTDDFVCGPNGAGPIVATGVFPAGVSNPDDIRVFSGPFANLTTAGPFATVAGAEGAVVVDLTTRQQVLNWTPSGPERDVLGSPLIGALPVSQPGANARAAMFGFGTTGLSTVRTALRNYDPASNAFGFVGVGFTPTFDASTVGGDTIADAFLSVGSGGITQYALNATNGYQGVAGGVISNLQFPGGQLTSAFRATAGGVILAVTRGHDGNTTGRVWSHPGTDTRSATAIYTVPAEARRIRCTNVRTNVDLCGVTAASGTATLFLVDPTNPTAPSTPLTVPTGEGTLGIALGKRANGNPYAVVANLDANTINTIEVTPDLALVSNTSEATPGGFVGPAHVSLFTDGEGDKVVVTGNGSANLWVKRAFQ